MFLSLRMAVVWAVLSASGQAGPVHGPRRALPSQAAAGGNVLVVLADDLGADQVPGFGVDPSVPLERMPNLVALAQQGIYFQRAWASPKCSPARAALQTGEASYRTGIGNVIEAGNHSLAASALTLPEMLAQHSPFPYRSGYFGKWHLERKTSLELCPPTLHGYDHFEGTLLAVTTAAGLCAWRERTCQSGQAASSANRTSYLVAEQFDSARDWITAQSEPWFCVLAPQSPYDLAHVPPAELQDAYVGAVCTPCLDFDRNCHVAALEAFDAKLGELLAALGDDWAQHTTVIFTSDNGTPEWANTYWPPKHNKLTLYEGGVRVPFVVAGRGVDPARRGTTSEAFVALSDVYRTTASLAGAAWLPPEVARDSYDLSPLLAATPAPSGRTELWAELFSPNSSVRPYASHRVALREARFKLLYDWTNQRPLKLYDLDSDPKELVNLLVPRPPLPGTAAGDALTRLTDAVRARLMP